jgi:hypothetical protein
MIPAANQHTRHRVLHGSWYMDGVYGHSPACTLHNGFNSCRFGFVCHPRCPEVFKGRVHKRRSCLLWYRIGMYIARDWKYTCPKQQLPGDCGLCNNVLTNATPRNSSQYRHRKSDIQYRLQRSVVLGLNMVPAWSPKLTSAEPHQQRS